MTPEAAHKLTNLEFAGHHLSVAEHTHIHRHLDELFLAGAEGVLTNVSEADQDFLIRNPADSGNTVEIIQFQMTASVDYNAEKYYNVDWPSGGTTVEPWCLSDHTIEADFDVQYTPTGDSQDLADVSTADRQIPGGVVGGAKKNPTPFEIRGADIDLDPGENILFRTVLDSTNSDIAYLVLVSEYTIGRKIDP